MANQSNNNASTVNLSDKYIVWCKGKSVGSFDSHQKATQFLARCPQGSYIQYPMGQCRDHLIAKARKVELAKPVDRKSWDTFRRKQIAAEAAQAKEFARAEIAQPEVEESVEEIVARIF